MNSESVTPRPMPVGQSILWKPLRDAHYILASLQPGDGGRRKIFVRQRVLADVQGLVRAGHGRRVAGILMGRLYRCSETGIDYQVIESLVDRSGADDLIGAIGHGLATAEQAEVPLALGWYCSAPALDAKLPGTLAAVHRAHFQHPWQTTLVIAGGAADSGGGFFLYDDAAARWFYAPFYELPEHEAAPEEPKPTYIAWPQYLTVDAVVLVQIDQTIPARADSDSSTEVASDARSVAPTPPVPDERAYEEPSPEPPAPPFDPAGLSYGGLLAQMDLTSANEPRLTPDTRPEREAGPVPDIPAELPVERAADTIRPPPPPPPPEKAAMADAGHEWYAGLRNVVRRRRAMDGTVGRNDAERFIEAAQNDGFVVVETFASIAKAKRAETLWVLADSDAGILLTVTTTNTQVVDATLHYNLRTDEAGLMRTPFPEHRDLASLTIYLRETCLGTLSRKRRLLHEMALEREWTVSPVIYFLTPSEWQSLMSTPDDPQQDASRVQLLNQQRISAFPEAIRHQFGLKA